MEWKRKEMWITHKTSLEFAGIRPGKPLKRSDISTNLTREVKGDSWSCEALETSDRPLLIRIGLGWYVPVAIAKVTVENRILAVCPIDQRKRAKDSSKRQLTG